ncbi:MAG: MerR family transcriptional regulator [Spirochaetales bacterium]|nr:MAG: MerR family transcriptional regulator [Spirochaetales bacterium]
MSRFTIGEVCRTLNVKPHILRYWEQEIGILSPLKDKGGRRVYSGADLQLLFRIKYLIYEKKYTVKGAAQQIIQEASGSNADSKAQIHAARGELLGVLSRIRRHNADTDGNEPAS